MVVIGVIVPSSEISFAAKAKGFKRTTLGNYFAFLLVTYSTQKVRLRFYAMLTINRQINGACPCKCDCAAHKLTHVL